MGHAAARCQTGLGDSPEATEAVLGRGWRPGTLLCDSNRAPRQLHARGRTSTMDVTKDQSDAGPLRGRDSRDCAGSETACGHEDLKNHPGNWNLKCQEKNR
ncbi:uncharacterized protein [Zea mays]|nr:uncharacterized protein LOC100276311 [Zea mays]|eukprot:XP_008674677.1 uncharacterized protein LOC100276311 [Zea mays]